MSLNTGPKKYGSMVGVWTSGIHIQKVMNHFMSYGKKMVYIKKDKARVLKVPTVLISWFVHKYDKRLRSLKSSTFLDCCKFSFKELRVGKQGIFNIALHKSRGKPQFKTLRALGVVLKAVPMIVVGFSASAAS